MQTIQVNDAIIRVIEQQVLCNGILKVMPADFYRQFDQVDLFGFCARNGIYGLPTVELLNQINALILEASPSRLAIEIGSGNGAIGMGLGIQCTDSYMQGDPAIQAHYASIGHAVVNYGSHVAKIGGNEAVDYYRPEVVVACWVTHKYNPAEHFREGNAFGVDEEQLLDKIKRYIFVGNLKVHAQKPLLQRPHRVIRADYLFSKSLHKDQNVILVWDR